MVGGRYPVWLSSWPPTFTYEWKDGWQSKELIPSQHKMVMYMNYGNLERATLDGKQVRPSCSAGLVGSFTVSPDGSLVAFTRERAIKNYESKYGLSVMYVNCTNYTSLISPETPQVMSPCWSPDGKIIAYWYKDKLWIIDATKIPSLVEKKVNLTDASSYLNATSIGNASNSYGAWWKKFSWSPDSLWIAFSSKKYGNHDIFALKVDNSQLIRLTNSTSHEHSPAWSPDGTKIAFVRDNQIFVMDLDLEAPSTLEPVPTTMLTLTPSEETPVPGFNSMLALSSIITVAFLLACLGKKNKGSGDRNG
jgi:Tol biopolymer transport system component